MLNRFRFTIKKRVDNALQKLESDLLGNLLWKISPATFIHSPIIDFTLVPTNFDLMDLTSCKVKKLMVEVGTGNGDFLSYIASKEIRSFIIGLEVAKDYFLKTKNNISRNLQLNAKVAHAEAYETIRDKFQNNSISKMFINFPDPWPKKKQWKNRFLTEEKFPIIFNKMRHDGIIVFVTDHMEYADFVENICRKFEKQLGLKFEIAKEVPANYPETKYFRKWKKLGKKEYRTITITKLA